VNRWPHGYSYTYDTLGMSGMVVSQLPPAVWTSPATPCQTCSVLAAEREHMAIISIWQQPGIAAA
jgi:hypothetical protein